MGLKANESLLNGKYLIERVLGRGGFGFVYLARDTIIGRAVAIKEMNPTLADDDQMVRRFLVEGRAALQLRHPNVVELYDVFSDRGSYYLAMEYCPGGSLDERLAAGPLAVNDALAIMGQVCAGLAYIHSLGIVHCDIKPANILFGADGRAKVTDFGLAHVSPVAIDRSWRTSSGFVAGTVTYMAPEQLDGVRDDPRVDVYALGALLYKMITGESYLNFRAKETISDQTHNVHLIKQGTPVAAGQRVRGIPAWLDRVVLQALSKQPTARFADAGALRAALQPAVAPAPAVSAALQPPKTAVLPPVRRPPAATSRSTPRPADRATPARLTMAAGGIGVLILAAVTLAVVLRRDGNPISIPTATRVALATATAQVAAATNPPAAPAIVVPTDTPAPASATMVPTPLIPSATPKPPTPKPAPSTVTPAPAKPTPAGLPAPVLVSPPEGASVSGEAVFTWNWSGPALTANQGFEVRLWKDGQPDHYGAASPVRITSVRLNVTSAYGITQGGSGRYFWTVAVVQMEPYQRTGPEAQPRVVQIELGGGGQGGASPTATPFSRTATPRSP